MSPLPCLQDRQAVSPMLSQAQRPALKPRPPSPGRQCHPSRPGQLPGRRACPPCRRALPRLLSLPGAQVRCLCYSTLQDVASQQPGWLQRETCKETLCEMLGTLPSVLLVRIIGTPAQATSTAGPHLPPRAAKPEETKEGPPAAQAQTRQQGTAYSSTQASSLPNGTAASGNAENHTTQAGANPQATNAGTVVAVGPPGGDRSRGETSLLRHF